VEVAGFVDSVSIAGDEILLNLSSGQRVPLDQVTEIIDPEIVRVGNPEDEVDNPDESTPA
jgi:hypothetical protein